MSGTTQGCGNDHVQDKVSNKIAVEVTMTEKRESANGDVTGKERRKVKERGGKPDQITVKHHLTNVAHFCVLSYVLLVCLLCFSQPLEFFTWHPLLLSIGWMLLMTESVLIISKENVLTRKLKLNHTWKERYHWVFLTVGAVLIAAGFIVVTINKNRKNKSHYTSWHGLLGLIGIVAYITPCLNGIPLLYRRQIKDYINPAFVKFIHLMTGVVSLTFGGMALILSVYTNWYARRTNNSLFSFYFGLIITVFPVIWTAQRPLIKCVKNVYNHFVGGEGKR